MGKTVLKSNRVKYTLLYNGNYVVNSASTLSESVRHFDFILVEARGYTNSTSMLFPIDFFVSSMGLVHWLPVPAANTDYVFSFKYTDDTHITPSSVGASLQGGTIYGIKLQ